MFLLSKNKILYTSIFIIIGILLIISLLSPQFTSHDVVLVKKETISEVDSISKHIKIEKKSVTKINSPPKSSILKPHHLYQRDTSEIARNIQRTKDNHQRYLEMQRSRENDMRDKRLQKHILQIKENKDV